MTTIAYRDGIMAADTQLTTADRIFRTEKILRLPDGSLFAGAGGFTDVIKVRTWVADGCPDEMPELSENADIECLWVKPDGSIFLLDKEMELMAVCSEYISIGTGSQYALAAMYMGANAENAVQVACEFDPSTSKPIKLYNLSTDA